MKEIKRSKHGFRACKLCIETHRLKLCYIEAIFSYMFSPVIKNKMIPLRKMNCPKYIINILTERIFDSFPTLAIVLIGNTIQFTPYFFQIGFSPPFIFKGYIT